MGSFLHFHWADNHPRWSDRSGRRSSKAFIRQGRGFSFPQKHKLFMPSLHRVCWLAADLTLVAGGDSPSAVIDFSSIFSSFVSSSTAVFSISCFFSGLAVLTILQYKKQRVTKLKNCFPVSNFVYYSTHHENHQLASTSILSSAYIPAAPPCPHLQAKADTLL